MYSSLIMDHIFLLLHMLHNYFMYAKKENRDWSQYFPSEGMTFLCQADTEGDWLFWTN